MKRTRLRPTYNRYCDEEQQNTMAGIALKDQVWQTQLHSRQIIINEDINDSLIEKAVLQIFNINDYDTEQEEVVKDYVRYPIMVYLNSGGGLLDEAFSLISAIESSQTPVFTCALGRCWSAAFFILLSGHQKFCQKYSSLMYHQGSAGINDTFGRVIEYAKYWESCQEMVENYVAKNTKIKKKKLQEIFMHKTDWYVTPKEALELGIVTEII